MHRVRLFRIACAAILLLCGGLAADAAGQAYSAGGNTRAGARSTGGFWGLDMEVRGGILMPDGSAAFTMTAPTEDDTYDEYWSQGIGGGADLALPLWLLDKPTAAMRLTLGPFLGFDHFDLAGDTKEYDNGSALEVDDWTATTFFGGAQLRLEFGGSASMFRFLFGLDVAGGMVSYGGVSADFIASPGATPTVGHIFDSSTTSALRGAARLGLAIALSDTMDFNIHAVGGAYMLGAPEGNTDTNNPFGDSDPEAWMPITAAVGLSLRIRF